MYLNDIFNILEGLVFDKTKHTNVLDLLLTVYGWRGFNFNILENIRISQLHALIIIMEKWVNSLLNLSFRMKL